jgi:hypothetical protein
MINEDFVQAGVDYTAYSFVLRAEHGHDENAWAERLANALCFAWPKPKNPTFAPVKKIKKK